MRAHLPEDTLLRRSVSFAGTGKTNEKLRRDPRSERSFIYIYIERDTYIICICIVIYIYIYIYPKGALQGALHERRAGQGCVLHARALVMCAYIYTYICICIYRYRERDGTCSNVAHDGAP